MNWGGMWNDEDYTNVPLTLGTYYQQSYIVHLSLPNVKNMFSKLEGSGGWKHIMVYQEQQRQNPLWDFF